MKVSKLMALVAVLCIVGVALAAEEAPKKAPRGIFGKIASVDGANIVVEKRVSRDSKETTKVTVVTDDKTEITLDGNAAKIGDLKEGMFVMITPATGTAEKVRASTKAPEFKKKPKEGDKKEGDK